MINSNRVSNFIKSKTFVFLLQLSLLGLIIYLFSYTFPIDFDFSTLFEHKLIIQTLGNLILYDFPQNTLFFYSLWFLIGLIPVIIHRSIKRVYSTNLKIFLILNFFFYVFLWKYSPLYFQQFFPNLFFRTIILGVFLIVTSISINFFVNKFIELVQTEEKIKPKLSQIAKENRFQCPYCSTTFESVPRICHNCSNFIEKEITNEKKHS